MHAAIKLVFGLILILLGLWLLVPVGAPVLTAVKPASWAMFDWWSEFKTVLKGIIPPVVIILGLLIVWIESEELKSPVVPEPEAKPEPAKKKKAAGKARKKK